MGTAALDALRRQLSGEQWSADRSALSSEEAFHRLLSAVVTLRYEPGELLTERQMADDLALTREPVRRAVAQLETLGLLESLPRKGIRVAGIGALDVATVYDARLAIEVQAARFAALRRQGSELEVLLEHALPPADEAADAAKASRFLEHDQALHLAIAALGRNAYLEDALTRILPASARLWHWVYRELGPDTQLMFSHDDIVEAIRDAEPDAAEAAVEEHLRQSRGVLIEALTSGIAGGPR